jgi:hypothetical protein
MDGLKRLSGAKEVSQDDFSGGVATYIVTFEAPPMATVADVKKQVGKYKLEEVRLKLTLPKAPKGTKVGDLTLAGDECLAELKALEGKKVVISGVLTDEPKGRKLTLSKVSEAGK